MINNMTGADATAEINRGILKGVSLQISNDIKQRNKSIVEARKSGKTFVDIGLEFGLCWSAIRKIIRKANK